MTDRTQETAAIHEETGLHSRLLRATLAVDESRAYWLRADPHGSRSPEAEVEAAFTGFWFGEKTLARVRVLLAVMRARFGRFPQALEVLQRWSRSTPDTRALICHWHTQLADPLYRSFTGDQLAGRRAAGRTEIGRRAVVQWIGRDDVSGDRWSMSTRTELASRLLSTAHAAGLLAGRTDPRRIDLPRVPDDALGYLLQLLRQVRFEGSLLDNPYLRSVGLEGHSLERRLAGLPDLRFRREGDTIDLEWGAQDLLAWARCGPLAGGARGDHAATEEVPR